MGFAQADLSLRWAHSHFVGFVMSRLISGQHWSGEKNIILNYSHPRSGRQWFNILKVQGCTILSLILNTMATILRKQTLYISLWTHGKPRNPFMLSGHFYSAEIDGSICYLRDVWFVSFFFFFLLLFFFLFFFCIFFFVFFFFVVVFLFLQKLMSLIQTDTAFSGCRGERG